MTARCRFSCSRRDATTRHLLMSDLHVRVIYRRMNRIRSEFERRTPLRNGNNRSQDAPPSSYPSPPSAATGRGGRLASSTPAAASTPTPTTAAARGHDHQRATLSPEPSHTAPYPLPGKRVRRRWGEGTPHASPRSAPPGLAAGGAGLFWGGVKDRDEAANTTSATATVLGSSQGSSSTGTAVTTATRGRPAVRFSPSSCGAYSPVDLRSAGRGEEAGGLGLGSPPVGVMLTFGEGGEGGDGDSPPRPRGFWREEWLRGCSGGGSGGDGCGLLDCPRNYSSGTPDERAPGNRDGMVRRSCCCRNGSSLRDDRCCRQCRSSCKGSSCDNGLRPNRCCSNKSLFRDARAETACCGGSSGENADGRRAADSPSTATPCHGLSGTEAEQSRREGDEGGRQQQHTGAVGPTANNNNINNNNNHVVRRGEANHSASCEGVSAVGLVILAAVAVAAFAAGTLVGPPHRQPPPTSPPPPPSASPSEHAPLLPPHQTYEPTLRESLRAERREPERVVGTGSIEHAPPPADTAESKDGPRANAVAGAEGGEVGGVSTVEAAATASSARAGHGTATGASGGEDEARPEDIPVAGEAEMNKCEQSCGGAVVPGRPAVAPGGETAASTCCVGPRTAAGTVDDKIEQQRRSSVPVGVQTRSATAPGTAATSLSPGGVTAGSGSAPTGANLSSRSTSPLSFPGAGAGAGTGAAATARAGASSEGKLPRRWRAAVTERTTRPSAGATPAAFAQTLGRAERSLADFSASGSDLDAERAIARRAAMSKSAARSACESLAWGRAPLTSGADPNPQDDHGVCDNVDSMPENSEGWAGIDVLSTAVRGGRPGDGYGLAAERTAFDPAAAATGVLSGSSALGLGAADDVGLLMSAHESGPGKECSLAGYVGLGPPSSTSVPTATEANKARGTKGGASHDLHSRADGGHGHSSPPLVPRCRGLVLSGNDLQASWVGRYVPVGATDGGSDDARQLPKAEASVTQRMQPQPRDYYYCLVPSSASGSSDSAGAGNGERVPGEEADKEGDAPTSPRPLPDVLLADEEPTQGAAAVQSETAAAAAGKNSPTPRSTVNEMKQEHEAATPETAETAAPPRSTLPAASTSGAAAAPGNDLGLHEVPDGGVLCLYWTDTGGGGRWVLDDDLRLSNGVLGVTKGPAPAAADLAFPGRRRDPRAPRPGVGDGVDGAATSRREAGEVEDVLRGGGAGEVNGRCRHGHASGVGQEDACLLEAAFGVGGGGEGAVAGGATAGGAGGRAPRAWGAGQPAWLLDSPRLRDWVEADDVFVECETV